MKTRLTKSIEEQNVLLTLFEDYMSKNENKHSSLFTIPDFVNMINTLYSKKQFRKLNPISLRTGAIAITEEMIIERKNPKRKDLDYLKIIKHTKIRFNGNITNRNLKQFDTVEKIHPEKPCEFYDTLTNSTETNKKNAAKKRHYRDALHKILLGKNLILESQEAFDSLKKTFFEVKEC